MVTQLKMFLATLPRKQKGLTTVEYAVAGGILVAGIIAGFILLGENTSGVINGIADEVSQ